MKTERDAAQTIRDWMQEPIELDDRGLNTVLPRTQTTPQRRHRWLWPFDWRPFGSGATRSAGPDQADTQWRYKSMFTATRMATATAVLALSGSLALLIGPLEMADPAPAGAPVDPELMLPAQFTGSVWVTGEESEITTELADGRTIAEWVAHWRNTMSDDRVSGTGITMDYLETIPTDDGDAYLSHTGVGRLTNDEGVFDVECTGAGNAADARIACWYSGQEGYEGLTAFVLLTPTGDGILAAQGWIMPTDRPPFLALASE